MKELYATYLVAWFMGVFGLVIGAWVLRSVRRGRESPPPITWLLFVMAALSGSLALHQLTNLLLHPPAVVLWADMLAGVTRLVMASAVGAGVMLQLALFCNRDAAEVHKFTVFGMLLPYALWLLLEFML